MYLKEGGNVFKTPEGELLAQRIATGDVVSTVDFIEKITGLDFVSEKDDDGHPAKFLGSTGKKVDADGTFEKNSSGDLDLSVDANEITKEQLIAKLKAYLAKQGVPEDAMMNVGKKKTDGYIKDAGDQVHFRTPINGDAKNGYVQTDFMFSDNPKFQQGSMRGTPGGQFKGMHRQIIMSSIARAKGMKWSPKFGLVNPDNNEVITNNWDEIAKQLLGPGATKKDVFDPQRIIDIISKQPDYNDLIAQAREPLEKDGITLPENTDLRRIKELSGL